MQVAGRNRSRQRSWVPAQRPGTPHAVRFFIAYAGPNVGPPLRLLPCRSSLRCFRAQNVGLPDESANRLHEEVLELMAWRCHVRPTGQRVRARASAERTRGYVQPDLLAKTGPAGPIVERLVRMIEVEIGLERRQTCPRSGIVWRIINPHNLSSPLGQSLVLIPARTPVRTIGVKYSAKIVVYIIIDLKTTGA
jgi:hypothetical protein